MNTFAPFGDCRKGGKNLIMPQNPLRTTLKVFEPYVNECAVRMKTIGPVPGCSLPRLHAEIFNFVLRRLNVSYDIFTVRFSCKSATKTLLQPLGAWGSYNETTDTFGGLLGDIEVGVYDCDINNWLHVPFRANHFRYVRLN